MPRQPSSGWWHKRAYQSCGENYFFMAGSSTCTHLDFSKLTAIFTCEKISLLKLKAAGFVPAVVISENGYP
jgi:hypothetical protein